MVDQAAEGAEFARSIAWLLRVQGLLIVAACVVSVFIGGLPWAIAALVGGSIGLFLTALTGIRVVLSQAADLRRMVRGFYRAMVLKFALAVILFVIVAKWFSGYFAPILAGYAVTLMAYWLAMRKMHLVSDAPIEDNN